MSRYAKLVLNLPEAAAAALREWARQQGRTVDNLVADVVDDWLEQWRREIRLGKRKDNVLDYRRVAASDSQLRK
jgi:hypothetical protein